MISFFLFYFPLSHCYYNVTRQNLIFLYNFPITSAISHQLLFNLRFRSRTEYFTLFFFSLRYSMLFRTNDVRFIYYYIIFNLPLWPVIFPGDNNCYFVTMYYVVPCSLFSVLRIRNIVSAFIVLDEFTWVFFVLHRRYSAIFCMNQSRAFLLSTSKTNQQFFFLFSICNHISPLLPLLLGL